VNHRIRQLRAGFLLWVLLLSACSNGEQTPEQQILDMIAAAEVAVESRSVTAVTPFVADNYSDPAGRDRRQLAKLLAGYFLGHQSIHLLVQIKQIEITSDNSARAELYVAMAGQPLENVGQLIAYRADLHYFDLQLDKQDGDWLVSSGQWRRANQSDFL
jgi:hypothetical protein